MAATRFAAFTLAVTSLTGYVSATCFDANNVTQKYYQSCGNDEGRISMCCALNRPTPYGGPGDKGPVSDKCLPNGLCVNERLHVAKNIMITEFWRADCTIQTTGYNPDCMRDFCTVRNENGHTALTPCDGKPDSETWCCGKNTTTCCGTDKAIKIGKAFNAAQMPVAVSTLFSSDIASQPTASSKPSPVASPEVVASETPKSNRMGTGAIIGCVVAGLAIFAAVLFGILFLLMKRRREQHNAGNSPYGPGYQTRDLASPYVYNHQSPQGQSYPAELMGAYGSTVHEKMDYEYRSGSVSPLPPAAMRSRDDDKMFELEAFSIPPTREKEHL
ncbi:hypothetical protein DM02DRAFT_675327 [Periconia macrospinosa]|uniref:Mid2 domain-containing protein n=1 Tax=Periconia macrospinosa TaxID=97972 RepID=A0A2V1DET1_9PLEO|nr:hypothetical protein DM02DRAFT_675327 [Periconia macrospinosa]